MNSLTSHLHSLLAQGPMSVETFMHHCLYHNQHGYYTNGINFTEPTHPLGRDFTTAPNLTPLFGACLANWVRNQWQNIENPYYFSLLEAGPGNGNLMRDMLTNLQTNHPACFAACQPTLIETSPVLTTLQQQNLSLFPNVTWRRHLPSTVNHQLPTLLIANELLDAFPIRQFAGDTERTVILKNGTFTFSHPDDAITHEDSPAMDTWLTELTNFPNLQAALLIDYGAEKPAPETLQALHRHTKVSPFHLPGQTDLTAHVNFSHVANLLGPTHCTLTDLAPFLLAHNLLTWAEPTIHNPANANALHRLLHPADMGSLFKVLTYRPE